MMKSLFKTIFLIFAVSYWAMSASAQAAEGQPFTIKGNIKGIKNGTKVSLRCRESGKYIDIKWSCMDFNFGECPKLENTPCHNCLDMGDNFQFKWNGTSKGE